MAQINGEELDGKGNNLMIERILGTTLGSSRARVNSLVGKNRGIRVDVYSF